MRKYTLKPEKAGKYLSALEAYGDVRKRLLPLRLFALPETGGQLFVATHLYSYRDIAEREEKRAKAIQDAEWLAFLSETNECLSTTESSIYVEAKATLEACGLDGASSPGPLGDPESPGVYEFRRYQLRLGYDAVPLFLEHYGKGLPSKLEADPQAKLVTLLYSDIGALNEVYEVWRHDDVSAMTRSRVEARKATEWRASIAQIAGLAQTFTTTIMKPVKPSVWN